MKASVLIGELEKLISEHGDCDVYYYDPEQMTGFDSVDIIKNKIYGFGNTTKIFYLE